MSTTYVIKSFQDLSNEELYALLQLRNEVFIVEQHCPYQDLDDKDQKSLHLLYHVDGQLAAYSRLLPAGISFKEISIGRVITSPAHRGKRLGRVLMDLSIAGCHAHFGIAPIRIGAQMYATPFYESLGFKEDGLPYDEDGIPHIEMVKSV